MTAKAVCAFVARTVGVTYTAHAMAKVLKRLGFVYKKPKCVPAKADALVQEQFAKQTLLPLMAQASADKPLYFVDGMHPSYTAHPGFGWIRRGVLASGTAGRCCSPGTWRRRGPRRGCAGHRGARRGHDVRRDAAMDAGVPVSRLGSAGISSMPPRRPA